MEFTYDAYKKLLCTLREHGYSMADYDNWSNYPKCVILRHDVDDSLDAALKFAKLEKDLNIQSTYFVLLTADLYNVFSKHSTDQILAIENLGHEIGLHFDEMNYPDIVGNSQKIQEKILWESELLSRITQRKVSKVSMHRPSERLLASNLEIPGMVNSYGDTFFQKFKYLSDSHHRWREPVMDIIEKETYQRLHILTHPIGYGESPTTTREYMMLRFEKAGLELWDILNNNFTNLSEVVRREELM